MKTRPTVQNNLDQAGWMMLRSHMMRDELVAAERRSEVRGQDGGLRDFWAKF